MQKKWLLARPARACHSPHTPTLPRRSRRCWRGRSLGRAACGRISLLGRILHPRSFAAAVAFLLAFCLFKRMFAINFVLGWMEGWASALGVKGYLERKVMDRRVQRPHLGILSSLWGTTHTRPRSPSPALLARLPGRFDLWGTLMRKPARRKPTGDPHLRDPLCLAGVVGNLWGHSLSQSARHTLPVGY